MVIIHIKNASLLIKSKQILLEKMSNLQSMIEKANYQINNYDNILAPKTDASNILNKNIWIFLIFVGIEERKIIMKKTMILTSMALMSLVAVGCANEEVKDTQDNQPVISTNMKKHKQKAMQIRKNH